MLFFPFKLKLIDDLHVYGQKVEKKAATYPERLDRYFPLTICKSYSEICLYVSNLFVRLLTALNKSSRCVFNGTQ